MQRCNCERMNVAMQMTRAVRRLRRRRNAVEELYDSGIQRIFRADDLKSVFLDQLFENLRAVPKLVY